MNLKQISSPDLPSDWELVPLQYSVGSIESGNRDASFEPSEQAPGVLSIGGEHFDDRGNWQLDSPRYISTDMYEGLNQGRIEKRDTLLVKDGATIGKTAFVSELPEDKIAANSHVYVIKPGSTLLPKLLFYNLKSSWVQSQIQLYIRGAAQSGLPTIFSNGVRVVVPPEEIQDDIIRFLDYQLQKIDSVMNKKERLIQLLQEKKRSIITGSVTGKFDEGSLLKESGIKSIGRVPAHWDVAQNRLVFQEINNESTDGEGELLSVSEKTGVTPKSEVDVHMIESENLEGYKIVRKGDLVINTMWAWKGAAGIAPKGGLVSPDYHVYRPNDLMLPEFADLLYRSPPYVAEMSSYSKGVWKSRKRLYPDVFLRMDTLVPPKEEQKRIVKRIKQEKEDIRTLRNELVDSIGLLKEKRQALITAAVTGQIDVSEELKKEEEQTA
jgi:type I restriction enzyme S subunit